MLQLNFDPFPVLHTPRLVLRQMTQADAPALYEMRRDKELMRHICRPLATCIEDAQKLIDTTQAAITNNEVINWAISWQTNEVLIGTIGYYQMKKEHYRAEIGYMLAKAYHGKGIMHEAITEIIRYGFETMKLHSIEAVITPGNTASERVIEKAGFVREALFRENEFFEGKFIDSSVYSLLSNR